MPFSPLIQEQGDAAWRYAHCAGLQKWR